ncbi:MAG: hypothetical protein KBS60_01270 [Phascolarctobacterium sp.]|nr:hypothetical protein [Candidatus Phascolarctobacterium caballi]
MEKIKKVKNVIRGLKTQYPLEEITIFTDDEVLFSGKLDAWEHPNDMAMFAFEVGERICKKVITFHSKAFIFT